MTTNARQEAKLAGSRRAIVMSFAASAACCNGLCPAIDPTSSDGIAYFSRESSKTPELIIELAKE